MSRYAVILIVMGALAAPGAWAQPLEFESPVPPAVDKRLPAQKPNTAQQRNASGQGPVYTYEDGDRTVRVRLQPDLEVSGDDTIAESSGAHIVPKDGSGTGSGQPVFRSESSGSLMTLPGGILVVLAAEWSETQTRAFFARHAIKQSQVSALDYVTNGFFVETAPGFPSLNLANTLAGQEGVLISSPNWWRERTTK